MKAYTEQDKIMALGEVLRGIIETINETPQGIAGGLIYAALMSQGCTLIQFESIMSGLCTLKKIRKQGDCYYPV